jgi:translocation protein SEC62
MARFEATRKIKNGELCTALNFILDKVGCKTHNGILLQRSSIKYFRGVNFHIAVLQAGSEILKMIPTLVKDGEIKELKTLEDSIRLGQYMIVYRNILGLKKDPRIVQAGNEKTPKYVVPGPPTAPMTDTGIYMIMEAEDGNKYQQLYLGLLIVVVLACMCFRLWPLWLKKAIWYMSFYLLVFLIVTAIFRVILWGILYHFGFEVWLFPNYWIDSNDPRDSFLPVWFAEKREDMFEFRSIIFRIISGSLIVYMGYQFCLDEKNVEDLKDLAQNGISDLFDYGQDFMIGGNSLGDGKPKNTTADPASESF